jgi:replicative DNA helicase
MSRPETAILRGMLHDEDYARKVLPFLKSEYFLERTDKVVYETIAEFVAKYSTKPSSESLFVEVYAKKGLTEREIKEIGLLLKELSDNTGTDQRWLIDTTEAFCKEKALYNAIMESIQIIDGKDKEKTPNSIPDILKTALGVSFDTSIGHDFIEDAEKRYGYYHMQESKIPFDLQYFNAITNGGIPAKTLNVCLAGTGVGKSLFLCHHSACCLMQNRNVLYITCEMAEERIAERIDANLMDMTMDSLKTLPMDIYGRKIARISQGTTGRLIIKEYPTATANTMHFKHLLDELSLKRNFRPDIVMVDYLNICASSRFKMSSNINSYTYVKAIAEELRGLAVECKVPIFTATQTNRSGYGSTDVELTDTSESFGLPQTADFMFAMMNSDQLEQLGQVQIKQLKNRYGDPALNRRFVIGIDRAKMKLYDLDASAQQGIVDKDGKNEDDEEDLFSPRGKKKRKFDEWS